MRRYVVSELLGASVGRLAASLRGGASSWAPPFGSSWSRRLASLGFKRLEVCSWSVLGASWGFLARLGRLVGRLGAPLLPLRASWGVLMASRASLGASWSLSGAISEEFWSCQPSKNLEKPCLLYTSPSPRDRTRSRMPSSA